MQQSHQRSENQRRSGDPAPPAPADAWAGAPVPHIHPDPQGGCQQVQTIDQPAAGACGDLEQPLDLHQGNAGQHGRQAQKENDDTQADGHPVGPVARGDPVVGAKPDEGQAQEQPHANMDQINPVGESRCEHLIAHRFQHTDGGQVKTAG